MAWFWNYSVDSDQFLHIDKDYLFMGSASNRSTENARKANYR